MIRFSGQGPGQSRWWPRKQCDCNIFVTVELIWAKSGHIISTWAWRHAN